MSKTVECIRIFFCIFMSVLLVFLTLCVASEIVMADASLSPPSDIEFDTSDYNYDVLRYPDTVLGTKYGGAWYCMDLADSLSNFVIADTTKPVYITSVMFAQEWRPEIDHPEDAKNHIFQSYIIYSESDIGLVSGNNTYWASSYNYLTDNGYYFYSAHVNTNFCIADIVDYTVYHSWDTTACYFYAQYACESIADWTSDKDIWKMAIEADTGYIDADDTDNLWDMTKYTLDEGMPVKNVTNVFDLPVPQNLKVLHSENEDKFDFNIVWDIPDELSSEDYDEDIRKNSTVEIMVENDLKYYEYTWSNPQQIHVDKHLVISFLTDTAILLRDQSYDYNFKNDKEVLYAISQYDSDVSDAISNSVLGAYGYINDKIKSAYSYVITKLFDTNGKIKKLKYPTFYVRLRYEPSFIAQAQGIGDGKVHYSNWVKLEDIGNCVGYVANEISGLRKDNDSDDDATTTPEVIDNTSGTYDGTTDMLEPTDYVVHVTEDVYVPSNSGWSLVKRILADVKEFPAFFGTFFFFLPVAFADLIAGMIVIIIGIGVFKKLVS